VLAIMHVSDAIATAGLSALNDPTIFRITEIPPGW
jgi:hypothetical protein